ncbi:MAG: polyisoprenyl-teichoic acid--peptidoglycan teichoic acid transferase, partial [Patescibacteria group bacterium]|nr:polyisoprenyl-teichoic acid--peptidoglycan teichoic acid transferase [Patescibacteria group bacterium]
TKAMSTETILNPAKLTALIQAAGDNVKTDLSVQGMLRLNDLTKDIPNDQIINAVFSLEPNGFLKQDPAGSSDLLPIDSTLTSIQTFVKDIYKLGPIWKENATIVIQNGTATPSLGGKLETKLEKEKLPFTITQVTNALKRDYTTTQIIDYTGGTKNNTKSYLEGVLKVTATTPEKAVKNPPQDFVIIIGSDYGNYLPTPSASPTTNSSSRR